MTFLLAALAIAYTTGALRLFSRAKSQRTSRRVQLACMYGTLATLYLALASPLDELGEQLLSAHMVQHLLIVLAAAPLLIWSRPVRSLAWSVPRSLRPIAGRAWNSVRHSHLARALRVPMVGWIAFCGTMVFWHVPAIYQWASAGEVRHAAMHLSLLCAALLFWSVVLESPGRHRLAYAASGAYVLAAALVTALPGALITFARHPLYVSRPLYPNRFGLEPLADQQLAGLIMWIPMDLILFAAATILFALSLKDSDRREPDA